MTTPALETALAERYRVERELGRGGMATVYLAHDLRHDRRVALKVMHPQLAGAIGPDRFLREIRIAAGLSHPNILPLYDSGAWAGIDGSSGLYFVMQLVEGESLRTRLTRERQLSIEDARRIGCEVAAALTYAHEHGIIHRDIKPENILLAGPPPAPGANESWRVVLADFGIARAADAADAERLTETGLALGTPAYMSPEQATAERGLDARSDVYALGCVLYEMLAGQPPFTGATARAIAARHALDPVPSLRSVRPGVPPSLERAVTRALAKVPADRFATAEEFARALEHGAAPAGLLARLKTRRFARAGILSAVALAALGVAGVVFFRRHPTSTRDTDPGLVVVLPFRVTDADSTLKYLRDGMIDLLAMKLTGEGGPRAVDPRAVLGRWKRVAASPDADLDPKQAIGFARAFGAGRLVDGSIVGTSGHLILTASVIAVPGGAALSRASVAGPADNLPLLVDRLTSQVLAGEAGRTDLASLTSLPTIRAYLDGKRALRAGHFDEALKDFDHSLRIDSTFALAALEFQEASGWGQGWLPPHDYGPRGVQLAWPVRDRLSPRDRALLVAHAGPRYPLPSSTAEFLEAAEQAVAAAPERAEAWYKLGDEYFHWGALLSLPHPLGQAAAAFRRAQELDSAAGRRPDAGPLKHLLEIAAIEGDTANVRRLGTLTLADAADESADAARWQMAYALGDSAALSELRSRFDRMSFASLTDIAIMSPETGFAPKDARRAVQAMLTTAKTEQERRWALKHLYGLALNSGRPAEALAALDQVGEEGLNLSIDALFGDGDSSAGAREFRNMAETADGPLARTSRGAAEHRGDICGAEQWRLAHGEFGSAPSAIVRLRSATLRGASVHDSSRVVGDAKACADLLEAWWASGTRNPDAARLVRRLDSLSRTGGSETSNLVIARLLEAQGDLPRALAAVRRRTFGMYPRYLSTFLREEGRLAALTGDTAGAIAAYRHYLALRWDPEPAVRPQVERVRSELAALVAEPR